MKKAAILILIVLNIVVLLGQIWPEGAPPFARIVNIIFLVLTMLLLVSLVAKGRVKSKKK